MKFRLRKYYTYWGMILFIVYFISKFIKFVEIKIWKIRVLFESNNKLCFRMKFLNVMKYKLNKILKISMCKTEQYGFFHIIVLNDMKKLLYQ